MAKKQNSKLKKSQNKKKEKFEDDSAGNPSDLIDMLSVSPTAKDPNNVNWQEQLQDFGVMVLKYLFLVTILTLNFLGLSVSLNCNADQELFTRIVSAMFAFVFGFVYLIINYFAPPF